MITVFMQHAKNFVSKDESRPIFCSVMFNGENAIATNSHQMVVVPFKSEVKMLNYKTGEVVTGYMPKYKQIISAENPERIVISRIGMLQWIKSLEIGKKVSGTQMPFCCIEEERMVVKTTDAEFSTRIDSVSRTKKVSFCVQIPYLLNILKFLKDVHESYFEQVVIESPEPGKLEPIIIKAGEITAAISQVRVQGKNAV